MKTVELKRSALLNLATALCMPASAAVIHVPSEQPTIQAGIDAAVRGDVVLVAPGTYAENISFHGKKIALQSEAGPKKTTIDGGSAAPTVRMSGSSHGTNVASLTGFRIMNGLGGVLVLSGRVVIQENVINACVPGGAAALHVKRAEVRIEHNVIGQNSCTGIWLERPVSALLEGNRVEENQDTGLVVERPGKHVKVIRNIIRENVGGVVSGVSVVGHGSPVFADNLIYWNSATNQGLEAAVMMEGMHDTVGGLWVNNTIAENQGPTTVQMFMNFGVNHVRLYNNVVSTSGADPAIACVNNGDAVPQTGYNDFFSAGGEGVGGGVCGEIKLDAGNVYVDPQFRGGSRGAWQLSASSPLIDAGLNEETADIKRDLHDRPRILDGGHGPIVDMGAFEYSPAGGRQGWDDAGEP